MKRIKYLKQYISFNYKMMRDYNIDQMTRDFPAYLREVLKGMNNGALGPVYRRLIKTAPEPLLVICHARTGSNFLLWLLSSHPYIVHNGEPFGANVLVHSWIISRIREVGPLDYLKEGFQRKSNEQVIAFKFLYLQFEPEYAERWSIPDLEEVRKYLSGALDMKVIHLKRRNRLENLISLRIAEVTKKYVLFNPKKRVGDIQIELTPEECSAEFEKITALEKHYAELFAGHPLLNIYYEDLYMNTQSEGKRILEFLDVKQRPLRERTLKQNIRPNREVLKNYDELKEHFADTVWGNMFND